MTRNFKTKNNKQKQHTLYYLNNPGFILCYGVTNIHSDGLRLSFKYPPVISFIRYTGETFSDGIIPQKEIHYQLLKFQI